VYIIYMNRYIRDIL